MIAFENSRFRFSVKVLSKIDRSVLQSCVSATNSFQYKTLISLLNIWKGCYVNFVMKFDSNFFRKLTLED